MFLLRILLFSSRDSKISLFRFSLRKQIPEARHSTATYCAEIFFPFDESNFKERSRATRWNWRKCNAAVQSTSLPVGETMHFADAPRDACVLLTRNISMTDGTRWEIFEYAAAQISPRLPLITKLTSLFFDGAPFVK